MKSDIYFKLIMTKWKLIKTAVLKRKIHFKQWYKIFIHHIVEFLWTIYVSTFISSINSWQKLLSIRYQFLFSQELGKISFLRVFPFLPPLFSVFAHLFHPHGILWRMKNHKFCWKICSNRYRCFSLHILSIFWTLWTFPTRSK